MSDVILVEGIRVSAALGVTAGERALRRPVLVDVELARDLGAAARSDALADTTDYGEVFEIVEAVAARDEVKLVEALAERIAVALLERFPVDAVRLTVRKIAPVAGALERAGVRIERRRKA